MKINYASQTDTGRIRPNNEDSYGEIVPGNGELGPEALALFVVADGMGGHRGGEIASGLAVTLLREVFEADDASDPAGTLVDAFSRANERIIDESVADASLFGMGTTCTAMVLHDGRAYFAHIGDSRAYLFRHGQSTQITHDHSLVGEMVRSGILSDEDARNHPKRNVITRSLGIQQEIETDTPHSPMDLQEGDCFVLCSDGLTAYVDEAEIERIVATEGPEQACRRLVQLANDRGGRDNITVQVVLVESL